MSETGRGTCLLFPAQVFPGKKGAQILFLVTFIPVSGVCIRKIRAMRIKSRETFKEREGEGKEENTRVKQRS